MSTMKLKRGKQFLRHADWVGRFSAKLAGNPALPEMTVRRAAKVRPTANAAVPPSL
jgi:hypothetical protein